MGIDKTYNYFSDLITKTGNPRERKLYEKFLALLSELRNKGEFEGNRIKIEDRLEKLQTDVSSLEKTRKEIRKFRNFLTTELALIAPNHYMSLGTGIGLALGTGIGISFGILFGMPLGLVYGMSFGAGMGLVGGIIWGNFMDKKAEEENRVLKNL